MTAYDGPACPVCRRPGGRLVHEVASVPVHSCLLMDSRAEAQAMARGRLEVVLCDGCGYLANRAFDPALTHYDARYEDSQAFSPTFVAYAKELATGWVTRWGLTGGTVVEIGAGRGDFSRMLAEAGASRVIAMDPTIDPRRWAADDPRVQPLAEAFRAPEDLPSCDAVVMRHVLEHVDDPVALLTALRRALADRPGVMVLAELPATERILEEGAFWDVYYEHCAYVTEPTARELFTACGFDVLAVDRVYDDQYLLVTAAPTGEPRRAALEPAAVEAERRAASRFSRTVGGELAAWADRLASWPESDEVVVWGSGSKGTAFLVALGESASRVSRVVDVNPHLHGKYVAGTGHPIVSPDDLGRLPADHVIVMNPVYLDEIAREVARTSASAEVSAVGR